MVATALYHAIFLCGLEESLAQGVGKVIHGKARLLFPKHANLQRGDERNMMKRGLSQENLSQCSRLRAISQI